MSENGTQKMSLSQKQRKLEEMLHCPHGRGQIYIRNFIDPGMRQKGAHLALRCRIREFLGMGKPVLELEEIVLVCCQDPAKSCEAFRQYAEKSAAG
jgi:hypothetical protein